MNQQPHFAEIKRHLDIMFAWVKTIYPDGLIQIQALLEGQIPQSRYFSVKETDKAAQYAMEWNNRAYNIYFGVNPRKPGTTDNAKDSDIEIAFCHFGDFDSPESVKKFRETTDKPRPHIRVITGDAPSERFHIYYFLDEPCRDLAAWARIQCGIIDFFGSDTAIKDARRIMRLAGTVSYPSAKKEAKGYKPFLVRIDDFSKN